MTPLDFALRCSLFAIAPFAAACGAPSTAATAAAAPSAVPVTENVREAEARSAILVVVDSLGAESVRAELMPELTAFAQRGVSHEGRSVDSWALPVAASLLTGRTPRALGMGDHIDRVPTEPWMVQEHLKCAGFQTGFFAANGYISEGFGFGRAWDRATNLIQEVRASRAFDVLGETLAWIRAQGDARFFAYVHLLDPHVPYDPPEPFRPTGPGALLPAETGRWRSELEQGVRSASPEELLWVRALYDGEARYVDHALGAFFEALEQDGSLDDTAVFVTSTHSELGWLREFGGGSRNVDAPAVRAVPLIQVGPGAESHRAVSSESVPLLMLDALSLDSEEAEERLGPSDEPATAQCIAPTREICFRLEQMGYASAAQCARCPAEVFGPRVPAVSGCVGATRDVCFALEQMGLATSEQCLACPVVAPLPGHECENA
ncbi:MAG: sulfatase-like hydrolase/transferase [Myxococcota bacterium]